MKKKKHNLWWPLLFLLAAGFLLHFLYNWSGKLAVLIPFCVTDESIFQHGKLLFWPLSIGFLLFSLQKEYSIRQTALAAAFSSVSAVILMTFLFYTYYYGFQIHAPWVNIVNFIFSCFTGYGIGLYGLKNAQRLPTPFIILCYLLFFFFLFAYFSFRLQPPQLSFFIPQA